jgi:hypothetical protein
MKEVESRAHIISDQTVPSAKGKKWIILRMSMSIAGEDGCKKGIGYEYILHRKM